MRFISKVPRRTSAISDILSKIDEPIRKINDFYQTAAESVRNATHEETFSSNLCPATFSLNYTLISKKQNK